SRMAIEASEFARDNDRFDEFHEEVFRSFFAHGRDIGDIDVLTEVAEGVGLDSNRLKKELGGKKYAERLELVRIETIKDGVTAAPTFIIEGSEHIVGAQPLDVFRQALSRH
ncbi:MAG: DsbA family protein, partial [Chloroflexota bacterium]|nr:DsbA family protein [Chloroflexota bacterium]